MKDILKDLKLEKLRRVCSKDPLFFIETFVKTFDPRRKP